MKSVAPLDKSILGLTPQDPPLAETNATKSAVSLLLSCVFTLTEICKCFLVCLCFIFFSAFGEVTFPVVCSNLLLSGLPDINNIKI